MNILGVSYKVDVQNAEWKSIQPLQCERNQGSLTGTNLSEGKRLDSWEVTHVQSEKSASTAEIKPKEPLKVVHIRHEHFLRNGEDYFRVFEQYAKGQISEDEFTAYSTTFDSVIGDTLKTNGVWGIRKLVEEMKENISKGIANTPDNLKTELSTGGIKLSWKELMNMQKTGEYIDKFLCETSLCGYDGYAKIGIARAYVYKSGLGLSEDQIKVLRDAVEEKIDKKLENTRRALEDAAADIQNPMWGGYYIGGTKTMPIASNTKLISEITEAFSKIDPNDKSSYDAAVDRFQELMRPWETTFAGYIAKQAPGYANSYVQNKEYHSRAGFQAIWNGTY
jgi:hypothetical protein